MCISFMCLYTSSLRHVPKKMKYSKVVVDLYVRPRFGPAAKANGVRIGFVPQ